MMDNTDNVNSTGAADFEALFAAAVDAICVIDETGRIMELNAAGEKLFGYSVDELKGQNVSRLMPEPDRGRHDGYIRSFLTSGERHIIGRGREVQGQRRDGSAFPLHLSVGETPKWLQQRRFVGIMRDLTDQKKVEEEARQVQDRLTHVGRFSVMGEMAAGLAHEINQPLSAIVTYSQAGKRLLSGVSGVPDDLADICEKISEQAERAGQVIKNLRSFVSKQEVRKDVLDINKTLAEIKTLVDADARAEGIIVTLTEADKLPPVLGDAVQLQQVIINLTRNAVDSMKGGLRRDEGIEIRTYCKDDKVHLSVTDHGYGVSPQLADSIFHPFVTTKGEGLGVGLAISRTIIHAHGGELSYRANPNGGSAFGFWLPIHEEQVDE
jgi:two-component system sensor kinase FixL